TMTFKELYKSASTPTQLFKTTEGGAFKLRVIKDSANADEVFVKYMNGSTTGFDDYDAIKLSSQISISAYGDDAKYLALTTRPLTTINDTIKLYLNVATSGSYNMTFTNSEEIAILDQVWLVDNYTNAVIDLKTTPNYIINVNTTIASSFGGNRFYIVVANNNPVPVKLLTFAGNKIGENQVALNWSTASEKNSESFEIEHAIDGKNFSSIGKVKANGNSNVKLNYAFNHNQASTLNYYRLKLINNDKTFEYSNTIMVDFNNTNTQPTDVVKIYPIPATTNLTVELNNQLNITQILVYNIEGLLIHTENTNSTKVDLNLNEFASGVYVLQIKDELGNVLKRKLIKQ
nr:T9SS type A sorting domain-containing protein [Bacteroidia bacterium]